MKPRILILSGWGPYKDRVEVDFAGLEERGLFLITGATGAGKTTLFDAITYALYGYMSGEVREKNSVRSDFADADTATFVELFMQHGGQEYHIIRNPEYFRPKRRQGGKGEYTKEKENAVIYMPDGSVVQGSSEVNRKVQEILVLDYRQYKQISMIAQGEFAKLLVASPAEKMRIFRELFATAIYDRFAGSLRGRSGELYKQVMEIRHRMEEDVHMLNFGETEDNEELLTLISGDSHHYDKVLECLAGTLERHKEAFAESVKIYEKLEKEIAGLTRKISVAEQMNEKLCKLSKEAEAYRILKGQKKEVEAKGEVLKYAKAAADLQADYMQSENEKQLLIKMHERQQRDKEELDTLVQKKAEFKFLYSKQEEIRAAYECRNDHNEKNKLLAEMIKQREQKQGELCKLQEEYLKQESFMEEKKEAYEAAERIYKRAAVGIAARLLREGEPCPVCGSCEHPNIAKITEEIPGEEELKGLKSVYQQASISLMDIHGRTSACKGEVQGKLEQEAEIKGQAESKELLLSTIERDILDIIGKQSQEEYEKTVILYRRLQVQEEEKESALSKMAEEIILQEHKAKEAEALFEQRYKEEGFSSFHSFEQNVLDKQQTEALEKEINDYRESLKASESLLAHLKEETKGKKETDISALKEELETKRKERQDAFSVQTKYNHRIQEIKKIRRSLSDKLERLQKLNKEYGIVKDLDNLASGNNPKRLVFEQYVLAGYFEEILRAANIRLAKMTNGRFELSRSEEVSDGRTKDNLEMKVLDYYTGKYRSVKTLSGGESFKASLALALGMSDVIQGYSGGIRVETLFIDEGFGSLDSESLEQACQTLMSLVEKDRLIGIISHVPELSEKIEKQIVITKTNIGSSIKVMI